ncbi:MAG: HEPN domain-containing protein [Nanoarchaeota archaeon]|nr:HEPN domain-containing protein [Nanoarchaeota archaeon]
MSHAYNKVKWCLNKAKKEIEESENLGKRPKHRGLVKSAPDTEEARRHIEKAEHNLKVLLFNREKGFDDWVINIGFYVIYQCFLAIIAKAGYESGNQTCTIALIEWLREEGKISLDQKYVDMFKDKEDSVIQMREDYTYGAKVSVRDKSLIEDMTRDCREIIDMAKGIVFR